MRFETTQKRNLTTAGIFFVLYILWDASTREYCPSTTFPFLHSIYYLGNPGTIVILTVSVYVYFEVKQQHDDFMYWIVEERIVASQTRSTDR